MKHIVLFSGGWSSAEVAFKVVQRYGKENVILVNHECKTEPDDVARFENEVANYLGLPITYVNFEGFADKDQFDVCIEREMFNWAKGSREMICTTIMKTEPFMNWLLENFAIQATIFKPFQACTLYYGFDKSEPNRVTRRSGIMAALGYKTVFPNFKWDYESLSLSVSGITPPNSYEVFKHANCIGCLKAGWQHWYCVYVFYPEIYEKAKLSESIIGHSIHGDKYLHEMEATFDQMIKAGIEPTEHIKYQTFWALAKKAVKNLEINEQQEQLPCACST